MKKTKTKKKNVDEELHKVNRKIKEHSKALKLPIKHKTEILINSELSIVHKLLHSNMMMKLHIVIYTIALAILTYLLGYPRLFFIHFFFGVALLGVTHYFHRRGDLTVKIFYTGLMIIPLYLIYLQYNDLLSLVMTVTFTISFVVAIALYFHHSGKETKRELHASFTRTFMAEWYAHVVSLSFAIFVAYNMPQLIFRNTFYSLLYIIIFWITPITLVYFFMNKFLYLRIFDPLHVRKDAIEGMKHAIVYSILLIACLTLGYLLTSIQITIQEKDATLQQIDASIIELRTAEIMLYELPYDVQKYQVTREIKQEITTLKQAFENRKSLITQNFGVGEYFSDEYFSVLLDKKEALTFLILKKHNAIETVRDLIRVKNRKKELKNLSNKTITYMKNQKI